MDVAAESGMAVPPDAGTGPAVQTVLAYKFEIYLGSRSEGKMICRVIDISQVC